jgi:hypothetical protein
MGSRKESTSYRQGVTAFIACSKTKLSKEAPARNLYQGPLFKKALKYAENNYTYIFILSAKYGIVSLNQIISPYEKTLNKMTISEKKEWYSLVSSQMKKLKLIEPFVFFTGILYNKPFNGFKPLSGLSLGKQLQWFNNHLKTKGFFE